MFVHRCSLSFGKQDKILIEALLSHRVVSEGFVNRQDPIFHINGEDTLRVAYTLPITITAIPITDFSQWLLSMLIILGLGQFTHVE